LLFKLCRFPKDLQELCGGCQQTRFKDMANKKQQEDHEYTSSSSSSSKKQTSELLDPVEMLQNPRLRLYIACIVAVTPFIVSGLLFVSSLDSVALQFLLGAVLGLLLTFSYQLIALYRTHLRNIKVRIHVPNVLNVVVQIVLWFSLVNFPSTFSFFFFIIFFHAGFHHAKFTSCSDLKSCFGSSDEMMFLKIWWNRFWSSDEIVSSLKVWWDFFFIQALIWTELFFKLYRSFSMPFVLIRHVTMQVVQVAQMSRLDANSLKELLPTEASFPSWIEFCDFEKVKIYLYRCWVLG